MIDKFGKAFLTMFGIGYFKYAPGTAASIVTCLIYFLIAGRLNFTYVIIFLIVLSLYSIILIDKIYKKKDAKEIVIDEFIGQSIPFVFISFFLNFTKVGGSAIFDAIIFTGYIEITLASLFFFRIFDILKPFPINLIDKKIKNSFGVVFDDIVAGILAGISVCIYLYFPYLWI